MAARGCAGATERRAKRERIAVVDGEVVHGVLAVGGVVVASQQTIDLRVDEQVVMETEDAGFGYARRTSARGTADGSLASAARVRFQTRHAERVAADQDFGANPEAVVAQSASEKLLGDGLWVIFPAVVCFKHVRIRHRRHSAFRHFSTSWREDLLYLSQIIC